MVMISVGDGEAGSNGKVVPLAGDRGNNPERVKAKRRDLKVQTLELLQKYNENHSVTIRNRLVELNMGLVRKEAHRWKHQCQESFDDLMQIGSIGLIQSIERFDISRGLAFSSFAMPYIRGEIQHYLRDKSNTIRLPRRWMALMHRKKKVTAQLRQQLGRNPSIAELRTALELTEDEWRELQVAEQNQSALSLDSPIRNADNSKSSLGDMVPDANYYNFQLAQEDRMRLKQAMAGMEERTRHILESVFFQDLPQKEVAMQLNVSSVTVSRQLKKGIQQLAQLLESAPMKQDSV